MAFIRCAFFPGGTVEHHQSLAEALRDAPNPRARRVFAAGPVPGGWQVVQVWDRLEDLDAFNEAWFLPALRGVAAKGFPAPPQVRDMTTAELWVDGIRLP